MCLYHFQDQVPIECPRFKFDPQSFPVPTPNLSPACFLSLKTHRNVYKNIPKENVYIRDTKLTSKQLIALLFLETTSTFLVPVIKCSEIALTLLRITVMFFYISLALSSGTVEFIKVEHYKMNRQYSMQ